MWKFSTRALVIADEICKRMKRVITLECFDELVDIVKMFGFDDESFNV
jgi:hypothetical protein